MASTKDEKIKSTLARVKARKAAYARQQQEKAIENVSPEVIQAVKSLDAHQDGQKDFMVMAEDYQAQHKCRLIDAMMAVRRQHPEAHEEYIRRANS